MKRTFTGDSALNNIVYVGPARKNFPVLQGQNGKSPVVSSDRAFALTKRLADSTFAHTTVVGPNTISPCGFQTNHCRLVEWLLPEEEHTLSEEDTYEELI